TADAVLLARSFAPLRAGGDGPDRPGAPMDRHSAVRPGDVAAIDPAVSWRPRAAPDLLRVPIGTGVDGLPVALDLKEAARGGMGPHGLVVGATGSGKSELLRTLVTALAISHPPSALALLVADFKGGATFSGLAALPHLAGMITNLESDVTLIDRFRDALAGELQRRQELFAAAGRLTSLDGYLELRRRRPDLESVPRLLVIVDEFSELLGARPDLADLFVTIGRIGRSIGIHLLLATQRLDTGRIRGLESHLSYRICLRTFSEAESREAIGSPVAYHLPAEPGWAYLRANGPELRRFRAATVSRPYRPPTADLTPSALILPFGADNGVAQRISELHRLRPGAPGARPSPPGAGVTAAAGGRPTRSVLEVAVDRLCGGAGALPDGQPVRRVWVEPLPARLTLGEVVDQDSPRATNPGRLRAVLGLVDVPERQRREVLEWDITDGAGNLLIVGAGRSGKSTAACTVLLSLARHPPGDVQLVCVDFGGGTMVPFGGLPHVAAVATRSDPDLTRRVFGRLSSMLVEREELLRRHRIASLEGFRRARAAGSVDPRVAGDVVVIIDGWAGIRDAEPSFESAVEDILGRGPGVGMHTVLTVTAPAQLRARLAAAFTRRIELRLGDAFDSVIDRHRARALPVDRPGRALVSGRHFAQLALPVVSSTGEARPGEDPTETAVSTIRARWAGRAVERIQTLPTHVRLTDLLALAAASPTPATPRPGTRSPAPLLL
ncbi:MAG TPA: FtsK/SpoIIIE domain-containing protein, partial [Nakamurella sp.]